MLEQESASHVRKFTAGRAAPLDTREHIELAMYTCKLMHGNVELVRSLMESGHTCRAAHSRVLIQSARYQVEQVGNRPRVACASKRALGVAVVDAG